MLILIDWRHSEATVDRCENLSSLSITVASMNFDVDNPVFHDIGKLISCSIVNLQRLEYFEISVGIICQSL